MAFGLFKRKDPVCGMKEKKGKGIIDGDIWFCSTTCQKEYKKRLKKSDLKYKGCCSK